MRRVSQSRRDSFEKFYLTKVALGDCCGCAERVIDWRDIEHAAKQNALHAGDVYTQRPTIARRIARLLRRTIRWLKPGTSSA